MTTVQEAVNDARRRFEGVSDSASLDAHVLLSEVLGAPRAFLLAHPEHELTAEQSAHFERLVQRHAEGEPIAYITGRRGFYDREFLVTPDVLIPRPETELLLERALSLTRSYPAPVVVDVGTGSGALAITFAANCGPATVYATDISRNALAVAEENAEIHGVADRVVLLQGDLLQPIIDRGIKADLVMANLPYIASDTVSQLAVSDYEPTLALDGGPDGLSLIRRLLAQLPYACQAGGVALLEIGADQGEAALKLTRGRGRLFKDYAGFDRILELSAFDMRG